MSFSGSDLAPRGWLQTAPLAAVSREGVEVALVVPTGCRHGWRSDRCVVAGLRAPPAGLSHAEFPPPLGAGAITTPRCRVRRCCAGSATAVRRTATPTRM